MAPVIAFYCIIMGTIGGGAVAHTQLQIEFSQYISSALFMAVEKDLFVGILKATAFGLIVGTISVTEGYGTYLGATGVGKSTQRAVIVSFLSILVFGYMITRIFYR